LSLYESCKYFCDIDLWWLLQIFLYFWVLEDSCKSFYDIELRALTNITLPLSPRELLQMFLWYRAYKGSHNYYFSVLLSLKGLLYFFLYFCNLRWFMRIEASSIAFLNLDLIWFFQSQFLRFFFSLYFTIFQYFSCQLYFLYNLTKQSVEKNFL
jgi:hypothetical protein